MSKTSKNIYKRKDGRWEGRCIIGRKPDNRALYRSFYGHSFAEVKDKINRFKLFGDLRHEELAKFTDCCAAWLETVKTTNKYSTYIKYRNLLNLHVFPYFKRVRLCDITTEVMQDFIDKKLSSGKINGLNGLSGNTVKGIVSVIHLSVRYGAENGLVCPCNFKQLKIKITQKKLTVMDKNEYTRLTDYLLKDIDYFNLGLLLCLFTGLRLGEICALKFDDISEGVLTVNKTMQRIQSLDEEPKTKIMVTAPKSISSERSIPVPGFLYEAVKKLSVSGAYVLTGDAERFVEPRTFQNRFKAVLKKCGLRDMNVHVCRHSFATNCVEMGCEPKALSEMLGHANIGVTLNLYVHPTMALKKKTIDGLSSFLIYPTSERA